MELKPQPNPFPQLKSLILAGPVALLLVAAIWVSGLTPIGRQSSAQLGRVTVQSKIVPASQVHVMASPSKPTGLQITSHTQRPNSGDMALYYQSDSEEKVYLSLNLRNGHEVLKLVTYGCVEECGVVVPMEGLPGGIYFLTLSQGSQTVKRKIIHLDS